MTVTIESVLGIILSIVSILSAIAMGVKFLVKHYFSELKPNSGSSMRDEIKATQKEVKEIKERQDEADILRREMNAKLDKMYMVLLDHVVKNPRN